MFVLCAWDVCRYEYCICRFANMMKFVFAFMQTEQQ
jgi:hypothetical protein